MRKPVAVDRFDSRILALETVIQQFWAFAFEDSGELGYYLDYVAAADTCIDAGANGANACGVDDASDKAHEGGDSNVVDEDYSNGLFVAQSVGVVDVVHDD